jgi:group II intron reverse transcriptase/maturase
MQNAGPILQAIRKLGEKRLPLTRVYRCLFSEDLFLAAYAKIYKNQGILTPGTENDTADDMSTERIHKIIEALRNETFKFRPSRRTNVPKKKGNGTRPLGLPNFTEKLVEEVLRMILEAYYEPRFRDCSHGFRSNRGCHTALKYLTEHFYGTTWFIEGDVKGCYDNISHDILMSILTRDIQDGRLLNLIKMGLKAGIVDEWEYKPTFSGTPQGGIVSPILANIYLNELDTYIEDVLIPRYTNGKRRAENPDYRAYEYPLLKARKHGNHEEAKRLEQERRKLPSKNTQDPDYRRLNYLRYADDFILSFIGPKQETEVIKADLTAYLRNNLNLELSAQKTLITHARTQYAKFLNYAVSIYQANHKLSPRAQTKILARHVNGKVRLGIPYGLVDENLKRYQRNNQTVSEASLTAFSDANIIDLYQARFRGITQYYKYASDRWRLGKLRHVMEEALVKTLAQKYRKSVSRIYAKYRNTRTINERKYKTLQVTVPTQKGERIIYWGAIPLKTIKPGAEPIKDDPSRWQYYNTRSDLIRRLQANTCELCGSHEKIRVHHVRKLADLKKRWRGRKEKPQWVIRMIALQRKTLIVCHKCHVAIHAGRPTPSKREEVLESRVI